MLLHAVAALAVQGLGDRPADLVRSAESQAYALTLHDTILQFAGARRHEACPPEAVVRSLGVSRLGSAGQVVGVAPADPIDVTAGVYKEHVRVDGCGVQPRQDNVLAVRTKSGTWLALPMLPGDSLTTPVQQHDALTAATQAVKLAPPSAPCAPGQPAYRLVDTFVTDRSQLSAGMWSERWVQQACGEDRTVNIHFMPRPDGKATSVIVEQAWPVAAQPKP